MTPAEEHKNTPAALGIRGSHGICLEEPDMWQKPGKTFRDPVHGNLLIPDPLILDLIDTFEFQRLRRIRQLGSCFMVFHGAEPVSYTHLTLPTTPYV